jgi:hypothetical protein
VSGDRPDLHTAAHDDWDQGGYCNALVVDSDGCGTVCGYRAADGRLQDFDALLVGPPTTGGLIRHRRAKPRNVRLLDTRRWYIHLRPGFRLGVGLLPHYPGGYENRARDGFDAYLWIGRLIVGFHWPHQGIERGRS